MKDDISHQGILLNLILPLQNHPETMSNIGLIKMDHKPDSMQCFAVVVWI